MPTLDQLLQFTFSGLTSGGMYALVALSLVLVYRASTAVNFAQGELIVFGALTAASASRWGAPLAVALVVGVACATVLGLLVEALLVRRIRDASFAVVVTLTIGLSLALRGVALLLWGRQGQAVPPFTGGVVQVGGAALPWQVVWIVGGVLVTLAALWWFLERTLYGLAFRGVADDAMGAEVIGIDRRRVSRLSWGLGGALAGLTGALVAPLLFLNYESGVALTIKGFVAMAMGGMTSVAGAAASGMLLGLGEAYVIGLVSSYIADALVFGALIAVLLVRPDGLFGRRQVVSRP